MKNNITRWISRSVLASSALLAFVACSDDHFDIKNNFGSDKTLWENIENDAQLSDFATLLKRTKVFKADNDRRATLTAAELLNQPQSFTIWAPINGTFNAKAWNDSLDEAEKLAKEGTPEATSHARELNYKVWNQFVANHIARFSYEGNTGRQYIKLLNSKNVSYTGSQFNSVPVTGSPLVANNGSMHRLNGLSPFAHNIYDYIGYYAGFTSINSYINNQENTGTGNELSKEASTPGLPNEKGEMVYIDSVYVRVNKVLNRAGANIRNEDSTYIAFIPTNEAWKQANEKVSKIMKYGPRYNFSWNGSDFSRKGPQAFRLDGALFSDPKLTKADSLQQLNTKMDIALNMFFAPYRMKNIDAKDSAQLNNYVQHADSLISTQGVVFYNSAAKKGALNAAMNPSLTGVQPYRASNGYIYPLSRYDFDPSFSWVKDIKEYAIYNTSKVIQKKNFTDFGTVIQLDANNYNSYRPKVDENNDTLKNEKGEIVMTGVKGDIYNNSYVRFLIDKETSASELVWRLPQVYSTKYELEMVMLPSRVDLNYRDGDEERVYFEASVQDDDNNTIFFIDENGKSVDKIVIDQDRNNADGTPQFDQNKVNYITLGKYIEFPKAYVGLPSHVDSFPRLILNMKAKGRREKTIRCGALNIIAINLKPYRGQ